MLNETVEEVGDGMVVATRSDTGVHRRVIYYGSDLSAESDAVKAFADSIGFAARALPEEPSRRGNSEADYGAAVQSHVDATARDKGYADGVALAGYSTSTVPAWAEEAQTFIAWRDQVWIYAYTELGKVQAGQRAVPAIEGLIAELPTIDWP